MQTFADLIEAFGGAAKMAPEINQPSNTIRQWSARGSIPARCWHEIIEAARRLGIKGVTAAALAEFAAPKSDRPKRRRSADDRATRSAA